jgi:hypothetical protein
MQIARYLVASLMGCGGLIAHFHEPEVVLNFDPMSPGESSIHVNHQSTIVFDRDDVLIFNVGFKPKLNKSHYSDIGFGYRKFFDIFGFGLNCNAAYANKTGFGAYQLSPGVELYLGHFQISYNHYRPLETKLFRDGTSYTFDVLSDLWITYKPSSKYEFSVVPHFNHSKQIVGISGVASAYVFDQWQVKVRPFYERQNQGVCLSVGFSFGGAKGKINQAIRKQENFRFDGHIIPMCERPQPPVIFTPIVIPPVMMPPLEEPEPDKVEPPKSESKWYDFFFGRPDKR